MIVSNCHTPKAGQPPVLLTRRLDLSAVRKEDEPALRTMQANPAVMRYVCEAGVRTAAETTQSVAAMVEQWDRAGFGYFLLRLRTSGEPVGYAGFRPMDSSSNVEIGYVIDEPYWGQGFATEAGKQLLDYGFRVLKFPSLWATVDKEHKKSQDVTARLGMFLAGEGRYDGLDCYVYSISKEQWQQSSEESGSVGA